MSCNNLTERTIYAIGPKSTQNKEELLNRMRGQHCLPVMLSYIFSYI